MSDPMFPVAMGAAELKRAAPVQFDLFVRSLQALRESLRDNYVAEDGRAIFQTQGKCQLIDQLLKKLDDCLAIANNARK